MSNFIIPAPLRVSVPVLGSERRFPVRRIYCVGQNYAAHVKEMGGDERKPPFFFQKPTDAIVQNDATVPYPTVTNNLHYEVELVLAVGHGGSNIEVHNAAEHVFGLAAGIDLTRRDVQAVAKKSGRPWEIAKAFDHSAPISAITPLEGRALPTTGSISMFVNGEIKQSSDLREMIWQCAEVIAVLSTHYKLMPGDLIYTGTPAGVGSVVPGDRLIAQVDGLSELRISIGERENVSN